MGEEGWEETRSRNPSTKETRQASSLFPSYTHAFDIRLLRPESLKIQRRSVLPLVPSLSPVKKARPSDYSRYPPHSTLTWGGGCWELSGRRLRGCSV